MMTYRVKLIVFGVLCVIILGVFSSFLMRLPAPELPVELVDVKTRLDGGTVNLVFKDQRNDVFELGFLIEYVNGKKIQTLYFNNFPGSVLSKRINVVVCSDKETRLKKIVMAIRKSSSSMDSKEARFSYGLSNSIDRRSKACLK